MADPSCVRLTSAGEVFERFERFLAADPVMSNLVASTLLHADDCDVLVAVHGGDATGMAMRWGADMTVTSLTSGAAEVLGRELASDPVESFTGPAASAYAVAGSWADATGEAFRPAEVMRVMRLGTTVPVEESTVAGGDLVLASPDDVDLHVDWSIRFSDDVGHGVDSARLRAVTQRQIDTARLFAWHVDGRTVSRLVVSQPAFGVVRIGGVYTPDDQRGQGYGSALTAAVSARLAERGDIIDVTLQTQSHEPHTNRMYRRIGFEPVGDLAVAQLIRANS